MRNFYFITRLRGAEEGLWVYVFKLALKLRAEASQNVDSLHYVPTAQVITVFFFKVG